MEDKEIKEGIANYWNTRGGVYDTQPGHGLTSKEEKDEWMKFLKEVIPEGAKRILDVGGGTGFLTLLLAELGYEVKSIDLSEGMQADAKRKAIELNLTDKVEFEIADAEHTNEEDESFDAVVNRHLLWTLPHPSEAVDEWIRVIKPGGKVIIIDGNWQKEAKKRQDQKKEESKLGYSEELSENLPMNNSDNDPEDFIKKEGRNIEIMPLYSIEEAEKTAFKNADVDPSEHRAYLRYAYIITK